MMKKNLALLLFLNIIISVQGQVKYQKDFISGTLSNGICINETNDHGFIMGVNVVPGLTWSDIAVIKTDSTGTIIWAKVISNNLSGIGGVNGLLETVTGEIMVLGFCRDSAGGSLLAKLDSTGNLIWHKVFGYSWMKSIQELPDSGFIMSGYGCSGAAGLVIIRTNIDGDTIWTKTIKSASDELFGQYINKTKDGGIIVTGYSDPISGDLTDIIVSKIDINGNVLWFKKFGGNYYEKSWCILETADSGFALTGWTTSFGSGSTDIIVIKTDSLGNALWSKSYGGADSEIGSSILEDGASLMIGGSTSSFGNSSENGLLMKIDFAGNVIWSNTFDNSEIEYMIKTKDGGFASCGSKSSSYNMHYIKTDSFGVSQCNEVFVQLNADTNALQEAIPGYYEYNCNYNVTTPPISINNLVFSINTLCLSLGTSSGLQNNHLIVHPNPASSSFTISGISNTKKGRLEIYNLLGEKIYVTDYSEPLTVNCELFSKGCYFVSLHSQNGVAVQKLIKQ